MSSIGKSNYAPAARSNSSTPGRVKIPHRCDGVMDDYASA